MNIVITCILLVNFHLFFSLHFRYSTLLITAIKPMILFLDILYLIGSGGVLNKMRRESMAKVKKVGFP